MAGNKYIANSSGTLTEVASVNASAGAGDANKIVALNASGILDSTIVNSKTSSSGGVDAGKLVALDGTGKIDNTMMPSGIGAETATITASEALAAGDWVNVWNSSGAKVRKADATTAGKTVSGFVLSSVSNGASATVYFAGSNTGVTGQTPGPVFLSTSPGLGTTTAPSGSGNVVQQIGIAVSATQVEFKPQLPITLA